MTVSVCAGAVITAKGNQVKPAFVVEIAPAKNQLRLFASFAFFAAKLFY